MTSPKRWQWWLLYWGIILIAPMLKPQGVSLLNWATIQTVHLTAGAVLVKAIQCQEREDA